MDPGKNHHSLESWAIMEKYFDATFSFHSSEREGVGNFFEKQRITGVMKSSWVPFQILLRHFLKINFEPKFRQQASFENASV